MLFAGVGMMLSAICECGTDISVLEEANDNDDGFLITDTEVADILAEYMPDGWDDSSPTAEAIANGCPLIVSQETTYFLGEQAASRA